MSDVRRKLQLVLTGSHRVSAEHVCRGMAVDGLGRSENRFLAGTKVSKTIRFVMQSDAEPILDKNALSAIVKTENEVCPRGDLYFSQVLV